MYDDNVAFGISSDSLGFNFPDYTNSTLHAAKKRRLLVSAVRVRAAVSKPESFVVDN